MSLALSESDQLAVVAAQLAVVAAQQEELAPLLRRVQILGRRRTEGCSVLAATSHGVRLVLACTGEGRRNGYRGAEAVLRLAPPWLQGVAFGVLF